MACNCQNKNGGSVIEVNSVGCQQTPCCASSPTQMDCNCNVGSSSVCGCTVEPASSTPFYAQAPGCQESHKRVVVQNTFTTGLVQSNIANMPAVGFTVTLIFPGLVKINIGSLLWNPNYGYLEVKAFDYATSTVIAENTDRPGNAAPGTLLPQCTLWQVVDNPEQVEPCNNDIVEEVTVLGCADGTVHPLTGQEEGQLLTLIDPVTGLSEYRSYDLPELTCTELTLDLTLLAGNIGPYVATVDDSSVFADCPLSVIIGCAHTFVNVNILSPTTISIRIDGAAPVANETYVAGTNICCAHCCDNLEYIIEHPCGQDWSDRVLNEVYFDYSGLQETGEATYWGEVGPIEHPVVSDEFCLDDIGCGSCEPIQVHIVTSYVCGYRLGCETPGPFWVDMKYTIKQVEDYADNPCPTSKLSALGTEENLFNYHYVHAETHEPSFTFVHNVHRVFTVPAGKGAHVCTKHELSMINSSSPDHIGATIEHMHVNIRAWAVAI